MASLPIPVVHEIEEIYGLEAAPGTTSRYQKLAAQFEQVFGQAPTMFARAPGRVNLIGEHIDYEGYGVLPMAIRSDTIVAIRVGGDKLSIANVEKDKYPVVEFTTDPAQAVDTDKHSWANYFLSAYKGVYEHLAAKGIDPPAPVGLQVMVDGIVPTGSGLSSSAAIVVSSSLAVLAARGVELTKGDVAEFTCTAERHVGVTSGGMDQAISVMGMPGVAMLVEFNPVRVTDVHLPQGATFVIANSLAVSNKAETADKRYNLRVVECRLAAALLARGLGANAELAASIKTLKEVEGLIEAQHGPGVQGQEAAVKALLHEGSYLQDEIESVLGSKLQPLFEGSAAALRALAAAAPEGYKLRDRALHVFSEAGRVHAFKEVCDTSVGDDGQRLQQLGALMDASHASCSKLFECSCPELEELVGVAKGAGAIGARLTGAGWGGCTVSLVPEAQTGAFLAALKEQFFAKRIADGTITEDQLSECLFASKPSSGAAVLQLKLAPSEATYGTKAPATAQTDMVAA